MRRAGRVTAGGVLAVAGVAAMGALTRTDHTATPADRAEIRLAWRARVPQMEECRRLTEAEQAELPAHMRREVVCEGRVASYRLEVVVDGAVRHRAVVEGAGARGDRPLYVFEAVPVAPGRHSVRVVFERIGSDRDDEAAGSRGGDPTGSGDRTGPRSERGRGVPDRLLLEERVELAGGDVLLITYDGEAEQLVVGGSS